MLRNYFLIAWRNFQRQSFFSLLNMFGLALGLASAIFIFLYVSDELRYDHIHPYYADTYRIGTTFTPPEGEQFFNTASPGFWVNDFAYRVHIGPWVFIGSLAGLLLVTFLTVGYEVWKAARVNPVKILRSE